MNPEGSQKPKMSQAPRADPLVPHNMTGKDMIKSSDFNFLMVLGKGSFGKVIGLPSRGEIRKWRKKILRGRSWSCLDDICIGESPKADKVRVVAWIL